MLSFQYTKVFGICITTRAGCLLRILSHINFQFVIVAMSVQLSSTLNRNYKTFQKCLIHIRNAYRGHSFYSSDINSICSVIRIENFVEQECVFVSSRMLSVFGKWFAESVRMNTVLTWSIYVTFVLRSLFTFLFCRVESYVYT